MKKIPIIIVAMELSLGMAHAQSPLFTCDFHDGAGSNGMFSGTGYATGTIDTGAEAHAQTAAFSRWHHWPNLNQGTLTGPDSNTMQSVYPFLFQVYGGSPMILNLCDSAHTSTGNGFMMMSMMDQYSTNQSGNYNAYIQLGPIDASTAQVVNIQFYQSYRKLNDHCYIDYSTDGVTWNETEINTLSTNTTAQGTVTYTLPYAAAGHSNLLIRLRYKALDTINTNVYGYYWIIDDVSVTSSLLPDYTVTVNANDSLMGTVLGGGVYRMGSTATLTAVPNSSQFSFEQWNDGNTENPRRITVTSDTAFTAFFVSGTTCTVEARGFNTTMGYVTGSGVYNAGDSVTLTAIPYEGYAFVRWHDGVTDNPRSFRVMNDCQFMAYFQSQNSIAAPEATTTFTLSPNPAHKRVRVELHGVSGEGWLTVNNATGQELVRRKVAPGEEIVGLDVSSLPVGAYFVTVVTPQGSHTEKLVISD